MAREPTRVNALPDCLPRIYVGVSSARLEPSPSNAVTSLAHTGASGATTPSTHVHTSAEPQLGSARAFALSEGFQALRPPAERSGQVVPAFRLGGEGCLLKQLHKLGDGAAGGLGLHPTLQFLHSKPLLACFVVTICVPWGRGWPRRVHPVALALVTGFAGDD